MANKAQSFDPRFQTSQVSSVTFNVNKLPPQNIEAEQSLLGALLIDKDAIVSVSEILNNEDFYREEQHGQIYNAVVTLYEKREPIDVVTVTEILRQNKKLDKVGGPAYLTDLVNKVPTAAHVISYARIIKEHSTRRRLISNSTRVIENAYNEGIQISEIIEETEQSIFAISQQNIKRDFVQIKDVLANSFDRLDELQRSSGKLRGVPTGFKDLDKKLAGFQDSNLIILAARPGMGKCLAYDSKIINPLTGEQLTIEEYVQRQIPTIATLTSNLKLETSTISNFVDDGIKPTFLLKTSLGKEIEVTAPHPFLTVTGWRSASDLKIGDKIAAPNALPIFGQDDLADYKIKSIAYFLTDGGLTGSSPRFTNVNPKIVSDFQDSILQFPNVVIRKYTSNGQRAASYEVVKASRDSSSVKQQFAQNLKYLIGESSLTQFSLASKCQVSPASVSLWVNGVVLPSEERLLALTNYFTKPRDYFVSDNYIGSKNSVTKYLQELELMGKSALQKSIPQIIFRLPKEKLAVFLNRMFSCDGCVYFTKGGATIAYCSSSKLMIQQMQHLLLRFGIVASIREKHVKYKDTRKTSFELEFRDAKDVEIFCREIGILGKDEKVVKALELAKSKVNKFTRDTIPVEIWDQIVEAKGKMTWREVYKRLGLSISHNIHAGRRNPTKETVLKIAQVLGLENLKKVALSDIYWDKIVSIIPTGNKQVYDLTVPATHNFVANDFYVHNTSLALNIAQYVAVTAKLPVGIFSLEMSQEELVDRLLVGQADIDAWKLKTGNLSDQDFAKISDAMGQMAEAPMFIDDTPGASLAEIRTKARRLQSEHGLRLIVVDYLQLIRGRNLENRVQEVSEISQGLKNLARELKVPVLALSQLSRAVEARGTRKPQLADLRESGAIEQDADVVMFIYREDPEVIEQVKLDIQKHRNGSTGDIDLIFRGDRVKFYGMEKARVKASGESKAAEAATT